MRFTARLPIGALLLLFAACAGDTTQPIPSDPVIVAVTPASLSLTVGETRNVIAVVQNAVNPNVIWRSSAPNVASVSVNGAVLGVLPGTATITAISVQDTTKRADVSVTVSQLVPVGPAPDTLPVLGLGAVPERYTGEVAVRGTVAYTSTWSNRLAPGNVVKVWNVAGSTPLLVDSVRVFGAGTTGDVQISDDGTLLVVAIEGASNGNGIAIYGLSNPNRPDSLARFASVNTRPGVHTVKLGRVNGRLYAFLAVNRSATSARLTIVDMTDPRNPVEVFSEAVGGNTSSLHDTFFRDGLLFLALWHEGFRIYDVGGGGRSGTPSNPVVLGQLRTQAGSIHNIWWFHDPTNGSKRYLFLGEEGPSVGLTSASGDIHVIDITDMAKPVQVAQYGVPGAGTHNFWMDEQSGILYAAYYNGGLRALDVRGDLGNCTAAQRNSRNFCDLRAMGRERGVSVPPNAYFWGVVHQGTHAYASDMKAGLYKIDASRLKR